MTRSRTYTRNGVRATLRPMRIERYSLERDRAWWAYPLVLTSDLDGSWQHSEWHGNAWAQAHRDLTELGWALEGAPS